MNSGVCSRRTGVLALVACIAAGSMSGCNNAGEGALSGAALGALGGLAIGSFCADAGAGAAIGAVLGGIGGAVIGDQNQRRDQWYGSPAPAACSGCASGAPTVSVGYSGYYGGSSSGSGDGYCHR